MVFLLTFFIIQDLKPLQYIDPLDRMPTHYQEYIATQKGLPFSFKIVKAQTDARDNLVAIVVNDSLYPAIQGSINQYIQDLTDEGYSTQLIATLGGTPADIRSLLQAELPNGLIGALLIGDLPIAWWEESSYGEDYPVDFFFSDLDGSWIDANTNGLYDQHSAGGGDVQPEIWVGRLYASRLTYDSEVRLINDYFSVNHQYRTGALTLPNRGLVYNEVTWYPNDHGMGVLYNTVDVINNENTTTAYDYKNRLDQQYQFVHLIAHSSCWAHTFFLAGGVHGGGSVYGFEIPFVDPNAFFYFLNCCMAARFTEKNNLANWYLFSHSYSQVVMASSSLMYGISSLASLYGSLSNDSTFGDAFKKWHTANYYMFMGTLILGDPSLKVLNHPLQVQVKKPNHGSNLVRDWTTYQVENSQFVNGHPTIGYAQNRLWILWDSGRIVRSDTYGSFFTGSGFAPAESIAWHEYYDFFPAAATDNTGRLWSGWQSFRDYGQYDHFNIYTCYYYNNSWSSTQYVPPRGHWHDVQPTLAAGSDDKVWIAFKSLRDGNANIYVSNAQSGGSWVNSYALTQTQEDETDPAITVDQDNNVWVFWSSSGQGHYHIFGRKYTGTWQNIFAVDTSNFDNVSVQTAVDSLNQIWCVWHRWINNQADIYYAYYNGMQWSSPQPLTGDLGDDILPSITIDELGRPWVCWMSDRNDNWDIYYSYYSGGWNSPQAVTNDSHNDIDPAIISDEASHIWVTWTTDRNNYWNIYAAYSELTGIDEKKEQNNEVRVSRLKVRVSPNPFKETVLIESNIPCEVKIYMPDGSLIKRFDGSKRKYVWRPKGLAQGIYFAHIKSEIDEQYIKTIYLK